MTVKLIKLAYDELKNLHKAWRMKGIQKKKICQD